MKYSKGTCELIGLKYTKNVMTKNIIDIQTTLHEANHRNLKTEKHEFDKQLV